MSITDRMGKAIAVEVYEQEPAWLEDTSAQEVHNTTIKVAESPLGCCKATSATIKKIESKRSSHLQFRKKDPENKERQKLEYKQQKEDR